MNRTIEIFYVNAMFYIRFKRAGEEVHVAQRYLISRDEIFNWLVAEKLP